MTDWAVQSVIFSSKYYHKYCPNTALTLSKALLRVARAACFH